MIELSWIFVITVLAAGLAVFDAISRLRGRGGSKVLPIIELVASVLMLVSLFVALPGFAGVGPTLLFAIILEIALLVIVFTGGRRKGASAITIVALVLNSIVVLLALGWITIPAIQ